MTHHLSPPGPFPPSAEPEPIPHIDTARDPIVSTGDLRQRWRALMGPLGFGESLLWFAFIDKDGRLIPALNQVTLPPGPDFELIEMLMAQLGPMIADLDSVSLACLLTRPGDGGITARDLEWSRLIRDAAVGHQVPTWPVHRANDATLLTMPDRADEAA